MSMSFVSYHANSNLAERVLREVGRMLRAYSHHKHQDWGKYFPQVEEAINSTLHDSTGMTPHEALFGTPPAREIEEIVDFSWFIKPRRELIYLIQSRLEAKAKERNNRQAKTKSTEIKYQVGERVLIKNRQLPSGELGLTRKLFLLYIGPFRIKKVNTNNTVVIEYEDGQEKGTININQIKPYKE